MFFNKKFTSKYAYTTAEILVTIGIIGVLAMMVIPIVMRALPSKEEKMHQKISYLVEELASHLYDNEAYYPHTSDITKLGFKNTDEVNVNGTRYGGGAPNSLARKQKFCHLFAHQFNAVDHGTVTCPENIDTEGPSFRSSDGVDWWIPKTTFEENTNGQVKGFVKIKVDVNGTDKGQNCTEGSANCKNPDVYYYYIKTNGSVTLSDPASANADTYQIIVQKTTKDVDGNVISNVAGNVIEIAEINNDGSYGTFSSAAEKFDNLSANKNYKLRAKPTDGYISSWGVQNTNVQAEKRYGYKTVRTTQLKNRISVEFKQIKTYCIKLQVDCNAASINQCVNLAQYKYNCKYTNVGAGNGSYSRPTENLDSFKYVGAGRGDYNYECSNSGNLSFGNVATGDEKYLKICGLETGDYQLYVTPANGMRILPQGSYYLQNVRLGTSDITDFRVMIGY